jgi:hypothetical protein
MECVEVGADEDGWVVVKNSRYPDFALMPFSPDEWNTFLMGAVAGDFEYLKLMAER